MLFNKVRQPNLPAKSTPPKPLISKKLYKWFLFLIILISLTVIGFWVWTNYSLPQSPNYLNNLLQPDSLQKINIAAKSAGQSLPNLMKESHTLITIKQKRPCYF
jgi:hypothetical protein